jgi:hypothetical protein
MLSGHCNSKMNATSCAGMSLGGANAPDSASLDAYVMPFHPNKFLRGE